MNVCGVCVLWNKEKESKSCRRMWNEWEKDTQVAAETYEITFNQVKLLQWSKEVALDCSRSATVDIVPVRMGTREWLETIFGSMLISYFLIFFPCPPESSSLCWLRNIRINCIDLYRELCILMDFWCSFIQWIRLSYDMFHISLHISWRK